jgi:hypothetical protein
VEGVDRTIAGSIAKRVDVFLDVNILLTLTFRLPSFLPACEKFRQDVKDEGLKLQVSSSVESIFDFKVTEANNLIGALLRGLVIYASTMLTGGQNELIEQVVLNGSGRALVRDFFAREYARAVTELKQVRIKAVEAWVVSRFADVIRKSGSINLFDFTRAMVIENQDAYDKIAANKNSIMKELNADVLPITPSVTAMRSIGSFVADTEDTPHLASICDHLSGSDPPDFAVYVTTDYGHILSVKKALQAMKIFADEPIWAIDTYKMLVNGEIP